jgi:hypothetical protein
MYQLALAEAIGRNAGNLFNWAGNQYGYVQGLANEAIPQYLQGAAASNALAGEQLQQYDQMYLPAQRQFNDLANSYSSAARQRYAAGQAESDATGAANAAWNNTKNDLQSHGIDPSSGEYAGLKAAAATAAGASAAGAGNQAIQATQNTGLGLQEQNINFGQTMPASALNAINTGYGGQAGAVNAGESAVNTGANAYGTANNFYGTAMGINSPPVGQVSQNTSTSNEQHTTQQPQYDVHTGMFFKAGGLVEPEGYRRGGHVKRHHAPQLGGGGGGATGDPAPRSAMTANPDGTFSNAGYNYNLGNSGGQNGSITYDSSSATPSPGSPGSGGAPNRGSALPDAPSAPAPTQIFGGVPGTEAMAQGGGIPEPHGHQGRPHPPHPYAVNGLPDASTGGHVPYELSPSHGHTTDDVVANLNAGEFVIPRRTVHHVGHKALYKLIADADKEMGLHPQAVGGKPLKAGSGADKARSAAESQNFSTGGGL